MRRDGARIDQGVCITSHASQCRTVDQVVVLPDGADAKGWYVSFPGSERDACLHARQGGFTSVCDVPRRAQVSVGACPSFAKVDAAIQESNDARSLGSAPSANGSRDWNGTLAAYCHLRPSSKTKTRSRKTVCGLGITKEVGGIHVLLRNPLFVSDMPHRLLLRVSLTEPTSAPLRF
jgi:hypothetical protein